MKLTEEQMNELMGEDDVTEVIYKYVDTIEGIYDSEQSMRVNHIIFEDMNNNLFKFTVYFNDEHGIIRYDNRISPVERKLIEKHEYTWEV